MKLFKLVMAMSLGFICYSANAEVTPEEQQWVEQ
jgi:hypothetical protein